MISLWWFQSVNSDLEQELKVDVSSVRLSNVQLPSGTELPEVLGFFLSELLSLMKDMTEWLL